jgi:hypothetical protein
MTLAERDPSRKPTPEDTNRWLVLVQEIPVVGA